MRFRLLILAAFLLPTAVFAQETGNDDPVYVLDSVKVTPGIMTGLTPDNIGLMTIAKGKKAVLLYGSQAENGVVYIETKPFARKRVSNFLRSVSPAYDSLRKQYPSDSAICFIVNDKVVQANDEARLFVVDRKSFISLKVLTAKELEEKYHISDRKAGVAITSSED
ncbi:hypothetical protein CLV59_104366 [Chitinophaga dinghuensis]|uniref:Uncharacterized protein n=1 Tax=Chitinophaga dinghuensis TaxID=1539050 RepID=A0A327VYK5_9BACT|nr:hypothetical protein [Chitinophaga dinghuensis]RAJ82141.1 hypothetical protein CLV59_104366 [Chitinophaga dinghuensis]